MYHQELLRRVVSRGQGVRATELKEEGQEGGGESKDPEEPSRDEIGDLRSNTRLSGYGRDTKV